MPALTITDLNNGKLDLDHLKDFATGEALTVTDRFGHVKTSVAGTSAQLATQIAQVTEEVAQTYVGQAAASAAQAAAAVAAGAYINFTNKSDGAPPGALDSLQVVDYHFNASGREPVMSTGRLIVSNQAAAGSGGLADYYQAQLGAPATRVGVEFTMPTGADDGNGNATYAAWDGIYEGGGTNVPKSWVHMSLIPGTGATGTAKWFVCNGIGNLFVVKQQNFTNPVADGVTPWVCESILDAASGMAYSWLPDGTLMTLSNAEIATMCGILGIAVLAFSDLASQVIMCEHFCTTGASAAKFAGFTSMFGETTGSEPKRYQFKGETPKSIARAAAALKAAIPPTPVSTIYAPSTQLSVATTTSAANIDGTNGKFTALAGPTGKVLVTATAYYEWSATDVLFWRLAGSASTTTRAADVGVSGQKRVVTQTIECSGFTPGQSITMTLQHWTVTGGSATCKAGGSGGGLLPPLTLLAIPA